MEKIKSSFLLLLIGIFGFAFLQPQLHQIGIGEKLPMSLRLMKDISETEISLDKIMMEKGILIIFSSNNCPRVSKLENQYNDIAKQCYANEIGFALINSCAKNRDTQESFYAMQRHAKEFMFENIYYLVDQDSKLANAVGAQTTPHCFLFNGNGKLVYKGAIEKKAKKKLTKKLLSDAIISHANDKEISVKTTLPKGCTIKRVFK